MDLFVSWINVQVTRYFSWRPDPAAIHVDALTFPWRTKCNYAFTPFSLIGKVLQKNGGGGGDNIGDPLLANEGMASASATSDCRHPPGITQGVPTVAIEATSSSPSSQQTGTLGLQAIRKWDLYFT